MIPFYSKRNQVYPVLWQGRAAVKKNFSHLADWQREIALYRALEGRLPLPKVLFSENGKLVTEYCPLPTLLAELERQEGHGFDPAPWQALADWLNQCHALSGLVPGEGNLRNFLWDSENCRILGLDLENFRPAQPSQYGPVLLAALLEYDPADTPVKQKAAALLTTALGVSPQATAAARESLGLRRKNKHAPALTGILLAGGMSRRMGRSKADLPLLGKPLLLWQVEKLRSLGVQEILLSGQHCPDIPGARVVPDLLPHRGPLGGLHACLSQAAHENCLVLSVDVPLLPPSALAHLAAAHQGGITLLRHPGGVEPLIGVYDRELWEKIPHLIAEGGAPVRSLIQSSPCTYFDYRGPAEFLQNCNTPEDFAQIQQIAQSYAAQQLPLGL